MKRTICLLLLALLLLAGCARQSAPKAEEPHRLRVVATVFPVYDWARNIVGEREADVELLIDRGTDLHSFRPSVDDILKISGCDLFIYVGGPSDAWVEDALRSAGENGPTTLDLLRVPGAGVLKEEMVEGMQADPDEEEEGETDEHVWLSLKKASHLSGAICEALCEVDPAGAGTYRANTETWQAALAELQARYEEAVAGARVTTLLFGDRFPFRYLTEDLGLTYYAAFTGCSAETEASFETITYLAGKVDELGLKVVLTIDGSDRKIAQTIVDTTRGRDQRILTLNSLQSAQEPQQTYFSAMEKNLEVLTEAME